MNIKLKDLESAMHNASDNFSELQAILESPLAQALMPDDQVNNECTFGDLLTNGLVAAASDLNWEIYDYLIGYIRQYNDAAFLLDTLAFSLEASLLSLDLSADQHDKISAYIMANVFNKLEKTND